MQAITTVKLAISLEDIPLSAENETDQNTHRLKGKATQNQKRRVIAKEILQISETFTNNNHNISPEFKQIKHDPRNDSNNIVIDKNKSKDFENFKKNIFDSNKHFKLAKFKSENKINKK